MYYFRLQEQCMRYTHSYNDCEASIKPNAPVQQTKCTVVYHFLAYSLAFNIRRCIFPSRALPLHCQLLMIYCHGVWSTPCIPPVCTDKATASHLHLRQREQCWVTKEILFSRHFSHLVISWALLRVEVLCMFAFVAAGRWPRLKHSSSFRETSSRFLDKMNAYCCRDEDVGNGVAWKSVTATGVGLMPPLAYLKCLTSKPETFKRRSVRLTAIPSSEGIKPWLSLPQEPARLSNVCRPKQLYCKPPIAAHTLSCWFQARCASTKASLRPPAFRSKDSWLKHGEKAQWCYCLSCC